MRALPFYLKPAAVIDLLLTLFRLISGRRLPFPPLLSPVALRERTERLGVLYVKLGQVLATRADVLAPDYVESLKGLLDNAPAMPGADFERVFRLAFGEVSPFGEFDPIPIAAATIAQVHRARLADGTEVAVKLRRFGVERQVKRDLRLLSACLWMLRPFVSRQTDRSIEAVLGEFGTMIEREVDFHQEAVNLETFHRTFKTPGVAFPRLYREFSNAYALTTSFEAGVRLDAAGVAGKDEAAGETVIKTLVSFYLDQMLVHGLFHADPHPGNILVRPDGTLVFFDFGMVKRLSDSTRTAMIEMVQSANARDFERYIRACRRLGVIAADQSADAKLVDFAARMFAVFSDASLKGSTMRELAFKALTSLKGFPFVFPADVVYVLRAAALIEGAGALFNPEFNAVKDVLPLLKRTLFKAYWGPGRDPLRTLGLELSTLPLSAKKLRTVFSDLIDGRLAFSLAPEFLELMAERLRRRLKGVGFGATLIAAGFFLLLTDYEHRTAVGAVLFVLGAIKAHRSL